MRSGRRENDAPNTAVVDSASRRVFLCLWASIIGPGALSSRARWFVGFGRPASGDEILHQGLDPRRVEVQDE